MTHRRAGHLAHFGRIELLPLSRACQQNPRRRYARHVVKQRQFQRFPGDFSGVEKVARSKSGIFLVSLEDRHYQCVGLNFLKRLESNRNLHSLPILTANRLIFSRFCENSKNGSWLESPQCAIPARFYSLSGCVYNLLEHFVVHCELRR